MEPLARDEVAAPHAGRIRPDDTADREGVFDAALRRMDLRTDLEAEEQILVADRVEDVPSLHAVGGQEYGVGVEQYRRDLGVHDVAVHRPEGEERIHPQGEPARHVHFPCAREGLHLCVARERAHDAPQVHVLDHFIVDDDHLADAQVRDGLGQ